MKIDGVITKYLSIINRGNLLEIGVGNNLSSLYLSKLGFEVEVIDVDRKVIEKYNSMAKDNNLNIKAQVKDVREFLIQENKYDLIIASNILHFLNKDEILNTVTMIKNGLKENGVALIRVVSNKCNKINNKKKDQIYYFNQDEILKLFDEYKVLCVSEVMSYLLEERTYYSQITLMVSKQRANNRGE